MQLKMMQVFYTDETRSELLLFVNLQTQLITLPSANVNKVNE